MVMQRLQNSHHSSGRSALKAMTGQGSLATPCSPADVKTGLCAGCSQG